jgi:hypothetical protein
MIEELKSQKLKDLEGSVFKKASNEMPIKKIGGFLYKLHVGKFAKQCLIYESISAFPFCWMLLVYAVLSLPN